MGKRLFFRGSHSMNILVTGGAGYIGSHTVRFLDRSGYRVWVYDNCLHGHAAAVPSTILLKGKLNDQKNLQSVLADKKIDAVIHFAALASVKESVINPALYYHNNVVGSLCLLDAMRETGINKIVFSSTTATYGVVRKLPITEDTPQAPINPYGFTKLAIEHALEAYAQAYGLAYVCLRYFNAAGASPEGDLGEDHRPESHLIPLIFQVALGQLAEITLFGNDYPTPDGTCIRDFVHVDDLATAHVKALSLLKSGTGISLNLGTGRGNSVREVVDSCRRVTGHPIPEKAGPRRPGDPPELVADNSRACRVLDWKPIYTNLDSIVATAWRWHQTHPHGYENSKETL